MNNLTELFAQLVEEEHEALITSPENQAKLRELARQVARNRLNAEINAALPADFEPSEAPHAMTREELIARLSESDMALEDIPEKDIRKAVKQAREVVEPEPATAEFINAQMRAERDAIDSKPLVRAEGPNGRARVTTNAPKTKKDQKVRARAVRQQQEATAVQKNTVLTPVDPSIFDWAPTQVETGPRGGQLSRERSAFIEDFKPGELVYVSQLVNRHKYAVKQALA